MKSAGNTMANSERKKVGRILPNMPAVSPPPDIEIDVIISKNAGDWRAKTTDKNPVISISPSGENHPLCSGNKTRAGA